MAEGDAVASVVLADGTRIGVGDDPVTMGRASDCNVVLADPTVSKRHAELRRQGTDVVLVDLGSTNGTWLNGRRIFAAQRLKKGDKVKIGRTLVVVASV